MGCKKHIGMDVPKGAISIAVMNSAGQGSDARLSEGLRPLALLRCQFTFTKCGRILGGTACSLERDTPALKNYGARHNHVQFRFEDS